MCERDNPLVCVKEPVRQKEKKGYAFNKNMCIHMYISANVHIRIHMYICMCILLGVVICLFVNLLPSKRFGNSSKIVCAHVRGCAFVCMCVFL